MNQSSAKIISISEHSLFITRKMVTRLLVIGSILSFAISISAVVYHYQSKASFLFDGISNNLNQLLKTNDIFEVTRTFQSLTANGGISSAWIIDGESGRLVTKAGDVFVSNTKFLPPQALARIGLIRDGTDFYLTSRHNLRNSEQQKLYTIVFASHAPVALLVIVFVGVLTITWLLSMYLRRQFVALSEVISVPLRDFAETIQQVGRLTDVPRLSDPKYDFTELNDISAQFGSLHKRLAKSEAESLSIAQHAAIGKLTQKIAHDIRSPFDKMLLCFESMRRAPSKEVASKILERTIPSLESSALTVREMLQDMVAVGSGVHINRTQCNLFDLTERVINDLGELPSNVSIDNMVSEDLTAFVDRMKMYRVISNLVKNAVQAISKVGGKISVTSELTENLGQPQVRLNVHNTNSFIPHETLGQIFEPFFRRSDEGSGLGLAIVKGMVEAHDGKVACRSSVENGTDFSITLPLIKQADYRSNEGIDAQKRNQSDKCETFRILVADDDVFFRDYYKDFAYENASKHFNDVIVLTADGPDEIRKIMANGKPDLILMDIDFGPMRPTGLEVTSELKATRAASYICLHSSRLTSDGGSELVRASGADAFMSKPMDEASFRRVMEDADRHRCEWNT